MGYLYIHTLYDLYWSYRSILEQELKRKSVIIQKNGGKKGSCIATHMLFLHSKQSPSAMPFAFPIQKVI